MAITSQQKGKLAEFLVFGKLIEEGADLYLPVIDTGIDAVVRQKDGTYKEIQVKSTKKGGVLLHGFLTTCSYYEDVLSYGSTCQNLKRTPKSGFFQAKSLRIILQRLVQNRTLHIADWT